MPTILPPRSNSAMTKSARAEVGLIMIQGAAIEHLVTLALIKMSKMDILTGLRILKGVSLKTKLSKLVLFVESKGDLGFAEKYEEIDILIENFLKCRNALAHASYAFQKTFDDRYPDYYFSDLSDIGEEGEQFCTKFAMFSIDDFRKCSRTGAAICFRLSKLFEALPLHEVSQGTFRPTKPPTPRSLRKTRSAKRNSPL